ncbi:SRPBCC family protein [Kangiella sp. TOML190]|uniref:SRPBCC family protein n=1 Tax=Kangiella sp. TOML190 TaxID=2931351 RepID=UPI00203CFDC5|nr:SRPBCC family protein [Kangiella sp. TOML190]
MKFLKWLLIIIALLVVSLAVIAFFLPKTSHVERSITINATQDAVFNQVNSFKNFNQWSPWADKDPNATYSYSGPEAGVGNKMSWSSDKPEVGQGSQEIIESQYPKKVKTKLLFGDDPNPGFATFSIEEISFDQTRLTWSFDADFSESLVGRYFGLMMDSMLGPDYEKGLSRLRQLLEN